MDLLAKSGTRQNGDDIHRLRVGIYIHPVLPDNMHFHVVVARVASGLLLVFRHPHFQLPKAPLELLQEDVAR